MRKLIACKRFALVFVFIIACMYLIAVILPGCDAQKLGRIKRTWSNRILRWLGCRVEIVGQTLGEAVHDTGITPDSTGRLLVSNHVSLLDIFALNAAAPSLFVAKAEIAKWPVFGSIAKAVGTIFIERGNKRALLSIAEKMKTVIKQGQTLLVFPEGTTSDGTGLLKLHSNLFDAAIKSEAMVVPVVLRYEDAGQLTTDPAYVGDTGLFECLWKIACCRDLVVKVHVLEPVTGEDRREMCRNASAAMARQLGVTDPLASTQQEVAP
ncbi:MAG: 1-acyl-sn-glycerol-3-phosphate acyltransferase [Duodenibacillus sp.]|nr:1-acyl-sn-glycerol-3-phosphate acyltransferase [Duodenibacillus sp.]